jgi:hypothetical protein
MNYWGILTPENQVALEGGTMLKELGTKTIFCLKESLSDTTLLKYGWNGETKALPFVYKWRKKDFAYFFIAKAIDEKPIFLQTPEQRDKIIDDFVLRNKKLLIKKE